MYYAINQGGLGIDKATAMSIMSVYGALIYMSSIPGAWIADRITGTRGATLIGAVLIIIGHVCLSLPFQMFGLFASMFFIIVGSGLMKPNISNIVGRLYPENDVRIDAGFVIFYMSVNLGALISPIILQNFLDVNNFHGGFLIAAIGMALGLVWYILFNRKTLGQVGMQPTNPLTAEEKKKYIYYRCYSCCDYSCINCHLPTNTLSFNLVSNTVLVLGIVLPIIYFATMIYSKDVDDTERSRVKAFIPLFILGMIFWSIQEQGSNVLNIYGLEKSDMHLNIFGWTTRFGEAWFQSINPLFILLFAPLISLMWMKMGKSNLHCQLNSLLVHFSWTIIFNYGLNWRFLWINNI